MTTDRHRLQKGAMQQFRSQARETENSTFQDRINSGNGGLINRESLKSAQTLRALLTEFYIDTGNFSSTCSSPSLRSSC